MLMKRASLLLALALAGCGTLPEPFYGNPGSTGARLSIPPAPVLFVPSPGQALLGDDAAQLYAKDLATELADYDVPSVAGPAQKLNWHLDVTAKLEGESVVPAYAVVGPDKKIYGKQTGAPVPAQGWANGDPATLDAAAKAAAPGLSKLMAWINAGIQQLSLIHI